MEFEQCLLEDSKLQVKGHEKVYRERLIFKYYSRLDHERQRKTKGELFTRENIEALLSTLNIKQEKLEFIPQDELSAETAIFMQNCKRMNYKAGDSLQVKQNCFIVLIQGIIGKKQSNNSAINGNTRRAKRTSSKNIPTDKKRSSIFYTNVNLKKLFALRLESNQSLSPKIVYYEPECNKPFDCLDDVTLLEFHKSSLHKLQMWINVKQNQYFIDFVSTCFDFQNRKAMAKIVARLCQFKSLGKTGLEIKQKVVYMICKGEIVLKTKAYQTILHKNSIIYFENKEELLSASSGNEQILILSIDFTTIVSILEEAFSDTLNEIKKKLSVLHYQRQKLWERKSEQQKEEQKIEPFFGTNILNIKSFQRNTVTKKNDDFMKYFKPRTTSNNSRFRIENVLNFSESFVEPESTIFLSAYPYNKIVEGEIKIHNILNQKQTYRTYHQNPSTRKLTVQQQKKVQKDEKKLYYMDKVRRLKIKNIAEREIPNGHRKKFKVEEAEKQIKQNSLFSTIVYPLNGVSKQAAKQTNSLKVSKKLSNSSIGKSKTEAKLINFDYFFKQMDESSFYLEEQKQKVVPYEVCKSKTRKQTLTTKLQNSMEDDTLILQPNEALKPHLEANQDFRYKVIKTSSHNRSKKQNNTLALQVSSHSIGCKHKEPKEKVCLKTNHVNIELANRTNHNLTVQIRRTLG